METTERPDNTLKIPADINYQCTGCGKCCSGWSVPMTEEDYQRINAVNWADLNPDLKNKNLFRTLKANEKIGTPYAYAINPEPNGQCPFLKDNLCFMHSKFGAQFKPSICQLFPYCFNETPDGVYTTVSFISRGAIFNSGQSLIEQKEYLQSKYKEFQKLYPDHHPNWSQIKLSSNWPLTWEQYMDIEKTILSIMQNKNKSLEERFIEGSAYLKSRLSNADLSSLKNGSVLALNKWDKILLVALYRKYFPPQNKSAKSYGQLHLNLSSFMTAIPYINNIEQLVRETDNIAWSIDADINDLLYRFFYSRLFAKLYFGAGFGQLSIITGFNHLAVLLAIIKLKVKALAMTHKDRKISQSDIIQTIVQLEKSLGELRISPYGAAILELLLSSQQRVGRFLCQM